METKSDLRLKTLAQRLRESPCGFPAREVFPHGLPYCNAFSPVILGCFVKGQEMNEEICAHCSDFTCLMDDVPRSQEWHKHIRAHWGALEVKE